MPIDRQAIVAGAREVLETEGVDALSMRRLAQRLGTKPLTMYHYVKGKDELLTLVLTEVAAQIPWQEPVGTPRQRLVTVVMDLYDRLREIPWIVPLLQTGTRIGGRPPSCWPTGSWTPHWRPEPLPRRGSPPGGPSGSWSVQN